MKNLYLIFLIVPLMFLGSCTKVMDLRSNNPGVVVQNPITPVEVYPNNNNNNDKENIIENNENTPEENGEENPGNEENNNGEEQAENGEEWLEEEEVNHAILTSKGFALLSDEGVLSYEGYDPEGRFAAIKDSLATIKIKNIYFNHNESNPAFAALSEDGDVFVWGDKDYGGNPTHESEIYPEVSKANGALKDVVRIYSTYGAFAALTKHKNVITWGAKGYGGDTNYMYAAQISSPLTDVVGIYSTEGAFAALKSNKDVEVWGSVSHGCGDGPIRGEFTHIDKVYANNGAFAMIKEDTSVIARGDYCYGGDLYDYTYGIDNSVENTNVEKILVGEDLFIAVRNNGTTFSWGGYNQGLPEEGTVDNVEKVFFNGAAYVALKSGKIITAWGDEYRGGNSSEFQALRSQNKLNGIKDIYYNSYIIFAVKDDGSAITWVDDGMLGDSLENVNSMLGDLDDIKYIVSSYDVDGHGAAYTVVRNSGDIVVWGDDSYGGKTNSDEEDIISTNESLTNIKDVVSTANWNGGSFAALTNDGNVITWGHKDYGADTTSIIAYSGEDGDDLVHIENIYSSGVSSSRGTYFVGVRTDGSYVAWGNFEE